MDFPNRGKKKWPAFMPDGPAASASGAGGCAWCSVAAAVPWTRSWRGWHSVLRKTFPLRRKPPGTQTTTCRRYTVIPRIQRVMPWRRTVAPRPSAQAGHRRHLGVRGGGTPAGCALSAASRPRRTRSTRRRRLVAAPPPPHSIARKSSTSQASPRGKRREPGHGGSTGRSDARPSRPATGLAARKDAFRRSFRVQPEKTMEVGTLQHGGHILTQCLPVGGVQLQCL